MLRPLRRIRLAIVGAGLGPPSPAAPATPSFRTEQADFFFRIRSCECVGLRREKSLFVLSSPDPHTVTCVLLPPSLHRPILHLQPTHPPEYPLIIRNQRQPRRLRMRRNPQIVVPDHLPFALQLRSHSSISLRRRLRQSHHRKHARQLPQQLQRRRPLRAFLRPVHQFPKRNHRERRLSRFQRAKPPQHLLRLSPPDVNANVRIQQEARLHHSPLRFCGLSFPRLASLKSAGSAASKSNARAIVPARSRSTISSPRRDISTSLLFTRNAFGSRTAWLFPDLNTFAVAIFTAPHNVYTSSIYVF